MAASPDREVFDLAGVAGPGAWAYLASALLAESPSSPVGDAPGGLGGLPKALTPFRGATLVLVRKAEEDLEDLEDSVSALSVLFGGSAESPGPAFFGDDPQRRLASLERLHRGARLVLATPAGLEAPAPSAAGFAASRSALRMGSTIRLSRIVERLAGLGYRRVDFVESPGEFAVRGAVVDFFPLEPLRAARILFNENVVESIRSFDPQTQAGGGFLEEVLLIPAGAEEASPGRVADWLRDRSDGPLAADALSEGGRGARPPGSTTPGARRLWLLEEGVRRPEGASPAAVVGAFSDPQIDLGAAPSPRFQGNLELAAAQIRRWLEDGWKVLLFSLNRGEDERIQEILAGKLRGGNCQFLIGPLRSGFVVAGARLAVLTTSELFERSYRPSRQWLRYDAAAQSKVRVAELKPGDYVVHQQYGVARYRGIRPVETGGGASFAEAAGGAEEAGAARAELLQAQGGAGEDRRGIQDCLLLEYRNSDKIYVPMPDFRLVQKFVGAEGHRPRLSSLDTRNWEEVKARVAEGVRELAEQLLKVQAQRAAHPGHAFEPDSHMELEFAEAFPYEETPDQRRALEEVKADMTAPHPMDRIVVGDVGFGKTEVAMRACLKCAAGLKQAAVLVPTTILADQHFRTFAARFKEYPVRIAALSRFTPAADERAALEAIAAGKIDVVIGTHRLLSPDVRFKDLGLLVIDEEHRFGVRDKERLKALKKNVDVLSLSATPIPRTLHQGLSGLRSVSLIQSAPTGRQPIVTAVGPWSKEAVVAAIQAEIARGGQAYYVYNKVRNLPEKAAELRGLMPTVRFCLAHGQMRSAVLETTMWDFFSRKYDVLVASSIIESGLDIPSVNTLIVEDAQDFGLAQLYQLRGRIGRERQKAYCHLLYPSGAKDLASIPPETRQRLTALKEFAALGSGFKLAMRDLEIRGAGDLLGAKQHGYINMVGVDYYSQLLQDEIGRLKGRERRPEPPTVRLDFGVRAYLPEDYLPGEHERLAFYKRLLAAVPADLAGLRRELEDLSGPLPEPAGNLFRLMEVRGVAAAAGVREASHRGDVVELRFRSDAAVPSEAIARWGSEYAGRLSFVRDPDGDGLRIRCGERRDALDWLEGFLKGLIAAE